MKRKELVESIAGPLNTDPSHCDLVLTRTFTAIARVVRNPSVREAR